MSDTDQREPDAAADEPLQPLQPLPASLVAVTRARVIRGYWVGALVAMLAGVIVYFATSTSGSASKLPEPRLTVAPRKPVPELKPPPDLPQAPVLPSLPVPTATAGMQVGPPTDPLHILKQQLDLQNVDKSRQLLQARLKSALDPSENRASGTSVMPELNLPGFKPVVQDKAQTPAVTDKNTFFARSASGQGVPASLAAPVDDPEHKILQGKVIEAIVLPRIISDVPGTVCALTQRDVYAERGRQVLIPWGSRMCGVYNAELKKGQNRLFAIWNTLRVAHPDGSISEVALDSVGSDQLGSAGTGGLVDSHFAEIFGTSALLSIIGAGAANMAVGLDNQSYSAEQYRLSVQQAAAQTAQSVLAPYVNIPPTVTVPAGTRIRIFVNRDLDFSALFQVEPPDRSVSVDQFE